MNDRESLYYDTDDAIEFIVDDTGIDAGIIEEVLEAELRYMMSVGIIEGDLK